MSVTFTPPEADEEDTGEDPGGLDELLASVRSEDEPIPKRGRGDDNQQVSAHTQKLAENENVV